MTSSSKLLKALERAVAAYTEAVRQDVIRLPYISDTRAQIRLRADVKVVEGITRLEAGEVQIARLEEELQRCRFQIRRHRAKINMSLSPFGLLPTETIRAIFNHLDHWTSIQAASQVCTQWREITLDESSLWTRPEWQWPMDKLTTWLDRSGSKPLHVTLRSEVDDLDDDFFLDILNKTSHRWEYFTWDYDFIQNDTEAIEMIEDTFSVLTLSSLQTMTLRHGYPDLSDGMLTLQVPVALPSLDSLWLHNVSVQGLLVPNLRHLDLSLSFFDVLGLTETIRGCPSLVMLRVSNPSRDVDNPSNRPPYLKPIELPVLEVLELSSSNDALMHIFSTDMHLPKLRTLSLEETVEGEFIGSVLELVSIA